MIRHLYNLWSDHPDKSSTHLTPHIIIAILLTIFPKIHFTSPWLPCNYQFLLLFNNSFFLLYFSHCHLAPLSSPTAPRPHRPCNHHIAVSSLFPPRKFILNSKSACILWRNASPSPLPNWLCWEEGVAILSPCCLFIDSKESIEGETK